MKELFLLSGLGADKRVFEYLDLSGYRLNYIEWVEPEKNEAIENYAKRLVTQIHKPNPILVGVSFGGIMAVEIGKLIPTEKIILISSANTKAGIPVLYRLIGQLRIHKLISASLLKKMPFSNWFFGAESERDGKLLSTIIRDTNDRFLIWAIDAIVRWKNETTVSTITHIHGTKDHLLQKRNTDRLIIGGGHFMIVNRAREVSKALNECL